MEAPTGVRWPEDTEQVPSRRGIPTWVWLSGAGCIGLVLLLIAGGALLFGFANRMAKGMVDPRENWSAIREVIAVDEPPPAFGVLGLPRIQGTKSWWIIDSEGAHQALLYHARAENAASLRAELHGPEPTHVFGSKLAPDVPPESGTIVVQGRTLFALRCRFEADEEDSERPKRRIDIRFGRSRPEPRQGVWMALVGPAILVDLSREGSDEFLGLIFVKPDGDRPIEDAQVVDFLKPFHVGPDR